MTSSARDGRTIQLGTQRDKGSSSSSGDRFSVWLQIATDFPDARWIQASVGVRLDTSSRVGGALSLTPGDDQDVRWGDTLSPGSLGFGFGFASGDTKPFTFLHHKHLIRFSIRVVVDFFLTAVRMIACSLGQGVCPRVEVGSCRSVRSCVLTCVPN